MPASDDQDAAPSTSASAYLTIPSLAKSQPSSNVSTRPSPEAPRSDTRLYVGKLHPSVDEYALIQTFTKYGKIAKLDFLFHKAGPMKGKPRGYAFIEYSKAEEALQAKTETHERTLRGRKLVVTFANANQYVDSGSGPHRRRDAESTKPTTLSLLKNASRPEGTNAKIAAMEAKLAQLREAKKPAAAPGSPSSSATPAAGKASLPPKPAFGIQRWPRP